MITREMLKAFIECLKTQYYCYDACPASEYCGATSHMERRADLAALCLELAGALEKQVKRCEVCDGDGDVGYRDMTGNTGSMPCPNCCDSRALLARLE